MNFFNRTHNRASVKYTQSSVSHKAAANLKKNSKVVTSQKFGNIFSNSHSIFFFQVFFSTISLIFMAGIEHDVDQIYKASHAIFMRCGIIFIIKR